jgi:hypothetical protein
MVFMHVQNFPKVINNGELMRLISFDGTCVRDFDCRHEHNSIISNIKVEP